MKFLKISILLITTILNLTNLNARNLVDFEAGGTPDGVFHTGDKVTFRFGKNIEFPFNAGQVPCNERLTIARYYSKAQRYDRVFQTELAEYQFVIKNYQEAIYEYGNKYNLWLIFENTDLSSELERITVLIGQFSFKRDDPRAQNLGKDLNKTGNTGVTLSVLESRLRNCPRVQLSMTKFRPQIEIVATEPSAIFRAKKVH